MEKKLTIKDIRKKFKKDTGMDSILTTIREGTYMSGLPKKEKTEQYNPRYCQWLEELLIKLGN
jgi:hypothetical protein